MIKLNSELEQRLQDIAARSRRTINELATDILTDYVTEVDGLEHSFNEDVSTEAAQGAAELVYVKWRNTDRNQ